MTRHPALTLVLVAAVALPAIAGAQWSRVYDQFYYPAAHNWVFRDHYPAADRLFNAFDYGHAILYETLWRSPDAPVARLEQREYDFLTRTLLVSPPGLPLEEMAIEPTYARLAPEAKAMFDWAHMLHRQLYDVLADERIPDEDREAAVTPLLRYYRSRPDLAFSSKPKTMALMEEQSYSLAFRQRYPKFNGLIWAYHWLQVGLYEPLVAYKSADVRQAGVAATVARFRALLTDAPRHMPRTMPMTAGVAPAFAARFPEAAIIFDNLHSMHDVISDILANPAVPRANKRREILRAAGRYRDDTTATTSVAEWRDMSVMMDVEQMGGRAIPDTTPTRPSPSGHDTSTIRRPTSSRGRERASPIARVFLRMNVLAPAPLRSTPQAARARSLARPQPLFQNLVYRLKASPQPMSAVPGVLHDERRIGGKAP